MSQEKEDGETGQQAGQEHGQLSGMESIGTVIVGEENKENAEERLDCIDIRLLLFWRLYDNRSEVINK